MAEETQANPDVEATEGESTNEQSAQKPVPVEGQPSRVPPKDSEELKKWLEALMFAAGRYMTLGELKTLCVVEEPNLIREAIKEMREEYVSRSSPLAVTGDHDAWKISVAHDYLDVVEGIMPEMEFDRPLLETLAVVAWRQPILQSEVVKIRSSTAYEHIHDLLEKNFIKRERYGRSFVLKTTKQFSEYFELPGREAVKKLFEGIEGELEKSMKRKEKSGDLTVYDVEEGGSEEGVGTEGEPTESSESQVEPYFGKTDEESEESESSEPSESEGDEEDDDGENGEVQEGESAQDDETSEGESDTTESDEEKTQRVIEELAVDDEPSEESEESGSKDESKERDLHPALENFAEKTPLPEQEETESPEPADEEKDTEESESSGESDADEESEKEKEE